MLEKVKAFVKQQNESKMGRDFLARYGREMYTEPILDGAFITYGTYIGDDLYDTMYEVDPETGYERHCGTGKGCFWTNFEPAF